MKNQDAEEIAGEISSFIAQHVSGEPFLEIQLKARLCIDKKYLGKGLHVCFPYEGNWYLYDHYEMVRYLLEVSNIGNTSSCPGFCEIGTFNVDFCSRTLILCGFTPIQSSQKSKNCRHTTITFFLDTIE